MNEIKSKYKTFIFKDYSFDLKTGVFISRYLFDDAVVLEEKFVFPVQSGVEMTQALDSALFTLHLIVGISYYKAYLPKKIFIESGTLSKDQAEFWNIVYTAGLGEFFYRNALNFKNYIQFPFSVLKNNPKGIHRGEGALVGIGGGKDSLVSVEMLRESKKDFNTFTIGSNSFLASLVAKLNTEHVTVERAMDKQLNEFNENDAWNGHVPITAINSCAAVVLAILQKKQDIIFSNERSANIGNVIIDGIEINHQFSKSFKFEKLFATYIEQNICSGIRYFSLLRPYSELKIVSRFVEYNKHFDIFTSCNLNFKQKNSLGGGWCCECPKCVFVYSLLAAFLSKDKLLNIFGKNLFEDESLISSLRSLFGIGDMKPFECVGEPEEMIVAFALAHRRGDLDDTLAMQLFIEDVLPGKDLKVLEESVFEVSKQHLIPDEYQDLL